MKTYDLVYFANEYDTQRFLLSLVNEGKHVIVQVRNPRELKVEHRTEQGKGIVFTKALEFRALYIILSETT